MEEAKANALTDEQRKNKQIFIVPAEDDYYYCEITNSIRRKDIKALKTYIGDKSLTTKQIKRLARQERKQRIRRSKKHEKCNNSNKTIKDSGR